MVRNLDASPDKTPSAAWSIARRDFLKHCGFVGFAGVSAAVLAGCAGERAEHGSVRAQPSANGFFADGTDFAD